MTDDNTAQPATTPPAALPWYRSPIIVSAVALIVVRVLNQVKTHYHIDLGTVLGMDANEIAEYLITGAVGVGSWIIIRTRAVQKHAPPIVLSPPKPAGDKPT